MVRDVADHDGCKRRFGERTVVGRVCGERDVIVAHPLADGVRTAAHRFEFVRLRVGLDRGRRTDRERRHRDVAQERPERMREFEYDRRRRRYAHIPNHARKAAEHVGIIRIIEVAAIGIVRQAPTIEVELHRRGIGRRAVGELRIPPKRKRPECSGRVRAPLRRECRHDVERTRFESHQVLHRFGRRVERDAVGLMRRIESDGVLDPRHDQRRGRAVRTAAPSSSATAGEDQQRGKCRAQTRARRHQRLLNVNGW